RFGPSVAWRRGPRVCPWGKKEAYVTHIMPYPGRPALLVPYAYGPPGACHDGAMAVQWQEGVGWRPPSSPPGSLGCGCAGGRRAARAVPVAALPRDARAVLVAAIPRGASDGDPATPVPL